MRLLRYARNDWQNVSFYDWQNVSFDHSQNVRFDNWQSVSFYDWQSVSFYDWQNVSFDRTLLQTPAVAHYRLPSNDDKTDFGRRI